jgi:hypothetical protein
MAIGLTLTKADLDNRMASVFMGLRDNLRRASELCALLNDTTIVANDAALTALGYTGPEVTQLRAAFTDLGGTGASLYRIATGAATLGSVNDFYFNAKHLTGVITS